MRKINKNQGLMRFVYILESTFHSDPLKSLFGYQATCHHSGLIFLLHVPNLGGQKLNYFFEMKARLGAI